ncbi:MAG: hypothetical protein JXB14_00480 [Candidatus Altiarchaeota archaeon]|nr:hypothetical protein [Candidatus Altiarchaeota archaeon]
MKIAQKTEILSETDTIYREFKVERGVIMGFVVVQIAFIDGERHQIVRYDCSHGYAHKDCLYERKARKEELPDRPLDELYKMAKEEIRGNWKHWKSLYIKNLPK